MTRKTEARLVKKRKKKKMEIWGNPAEITANRKSI